MDIDRFYRFLGTAIKSIWHRVALRPVKNFNLENRAEKALKIPKAAPWHESTQKLIDQIRKEGNFQELDNRNDNLLDRLKSVKVNTPNDDIVENTTDEELKKKLPQERFGADLPYVFYKPEKMPHGKITVIDALEMMINHQKLNLQSKELSEKYNLAEEDVEKLIRYVDVFKAVNKEKENIEMFTMRMDVDISQIGDGSEIIHRKKIVKQNKSTEENN